MLQEDILIKIGEDLNYLTEGKAPGQVDKIMEDVHKLIELFN